MNTFQLCKIHGFSITAAIAGCGLLTAGLLLDGFQLSDLRLIGGSVVLGAVCWCVIPAVRTFEGGYVMGHARGFYDGLHAPMVDVPNDVSGITDPQGPTAPYRSGTYPDGRIAE